MIRLLLNIISIYIFIIVGGCDHDSSNEMPVSFEFRLLNENSEVATVFEEGENFVLSFLIINDTNEPLFLDQSSIVTEDFLKIYDTNNLNQETGKEFSMGKPYELIFCLYTNGIAIPPNDTLKLEIPWIPNNPWDVNAPYFNTAFCIVNSENIPLPKGDYFSGFSSPFVISVSGEPFSISEQVFNINFTIN